LVMPRSTSALKAAARIICGAMRGTIEPRMVIKSC
jgi:hypothetical protein